MNLGFFFVSRSNDFFLFQSAKNQKRLMKQAAEEKRLLVSQRLREYAQLRYLLDHRPSVNKFFHFSNE